MGRCRVERLMRQMGLAGEGRGIDAKRRRLAGQPLGSQTIVLERGPGIWTRRPAGRQLVPPESEDAPLSCGMVRRAFRGRL